MLGEKLKMIRKQADMSQEKLAEKLGVSRQAITKWETDAGMPDIENIMAISTLFDISMDELLWEKRAAKKASDYLFESVTEYDIAEPKRYDIKLGGAKQVTLSAYDGEKLCVRLASNTLSTLQQDLKVRIDDVRSRLDVELIRQNGVTEAAAKEAVAIFVQLPQRYLGKLELAAHADTVALSSLSCESIELNLKSRSVTLSDVVGTVEIDCNLDMNIVCHSLQGSVDINQLSATSRISIPEGTPFCAVAKGIGNSISYEKDGKAAPAFDTPHAENVIELNGMKSELVICTAARE